MRYFFKNIAIFSTFFSYKMERIFNRMNCNNSCRIKKTALLEMKTALFFRRRDTLLIYSCYYGSWLWLMARVD